MALTRRKVRRPMRGASMTAPYALASPLWAGRGGNLRSSPAGRGRVVNRLADAQVRSTPADGAFHGLVDLGVGGLRLPGQQGRGRHDLAGLAVAALRHVEVHPRSLE